MEVVGVIPGLTSANYKYSTVANMIFVIPNPVIRAQAVVAISENETNVE